MATIAAAAVAAPATLAGEPRQKPAAPAKTAAAQRGRAALGPVDQAEVAARYDAMIARYGSRLSEEQKKRAREDLEAMQRGLGPLRAFPLDNGDEPAENYVPLVEGAGAGAEE
jgi:hypothetical protein